MWDAQLLPVTAACRQLHHNLPCSAEQYEADVRESLFRIYCSEPWNDKQAAAPEVASEKLYIDGVPCNMVTRTGRPSKLPEWLSEEELQYYVSEYEANGFAGGLHWYQTMDLNATISPDTMRGKPQILQPALFLAGDRDLVILFSGGKESVEARMKKKCPNLSKCVFYERCGHWIQQERAADVNQELLSWLGTLDLDRVRPVASRL